MKQFTKLLMLALFALISLPGWAEEVTYNFADMKGFSTWGNSYSKKSHTFDDGAYVELASAGKQTTTITTMPITKGGDVIFKAPTGKKIKGLTFTCQQWGTKGQTITLHTSTDGETFTKSNTTSSNFVLTASDLSDNITAVKFTFNSTSNQVGIQSLTVNYSDEIVTPKTVESIAVSGTPAELYTFDAFSHDGITVTATYDDESTADVTSSCAYTGFDNTQTGEQTITVTYEGKTTTYTVNVTSIANTQETAYTVAEARTLIDAGKGLSQGVFVKGIISEITSEYNSQYGNISFNISDDGTTTSDQFNFFRNQKDADNKFDEDPGYTAGATVIGYGKLTKYNSTYEFEEGNYLVSYTAGQAIASLSFDPVTITGYLDAASEFVAPALTPTNVQETEITYTSSNVAVATVDESGAVTLVGVGETTITASCTETAEHTAATASYTLTVEANKPAVVKYAIVAKYEDKWYAATTEVNNSKLKAVEVTVSNNEVFYQGDADIVWLWDE
ncbi:MAG: bacterial Ig-like domain-containing protein, partial [Bacteroidaceae bacterium]|nr:bacterial Ig-like domain-containing protein [Bacteroidaceae bacterium]